MPVSVTFNGTLYNIPASGETGWGTTTTNFLVDVGGHALALTATQTMTNKVVELQPGNVGAPALSFTADTASGVYQPSTSQVAIATAGVQRLLVDTTGNVTLSATPTLTDSSNKVATTQFVSTAPIVYNQIGRNLVHNPLFNIAQRGVGAFTSNGVYTLDRWVINLTGDSDSVIQLALSDGDRAAIGDEAVEFGLSNTFTGVAGSTNFSLLVQRIEDVKRLSNKTVTVSFWAKIAVGTIKLGVSIDQTFGSGGSTAVNIAGQAVNLTTTWTRFNLQFVLGSASGKTIGAGSYTQLDFWYSAGSSFNTRSGSIGTQGTAATVTLWGVQVEIGSVMTPLEKPDPRYDLSNCQRFYAADNRSIAVGWDAWAAGAFFYYPIYFPVTMRATPSLINFGALTANTNTASVALAAASSAGSFSLQNNSTAAGGTAITIAGWNATADL